MFKSDILFQNVNQRQLNLSIGSIIVAARLKCADNVTLNMSVKSTFQIDRRVRKFNGAVYKYILCNDYSFLDGRTIHRQCMCHVG